MYHALAFGQKRDGSNISEWVIIKRFTRGIYSLTEKIKGEGLMKRRRQAAESQEKGVQAVRLRLADIYGGMISSRLKEDAALPVLAQSIARHGLLQPIVVQENEENGRYMLVCGARRLAACRLLGMTQIDAVQISGRKPDAAACFLEDHFTRQTAPFLKEAALLQRAEVAEKCCLPEGEIRRRLAMLKLDEETQNAVMRGNLSLEQAEPLLDAPKSNRVEVAGIIAERNLSAEQARRLVSKSENCAEHGKRRAVRRATEEAQRLCDGLSAQGLHASLSVCAQGQGLCIQILIKNEHLSS